MNDKRKKYNGGISPRYIFHVGARGITMRNDTITLQDITIPQQC